MVLKSCLTTFIVALLLSSFSISKEMDKMLSLPIGKSKCPHFSFSGPPNWILKSGRKKGDRWLIWDVTAKKQIARFDYNLSNTDQKQLPEVFSGEVKLGTFSADKFTITMEPVNGEEPEKIITGLVTSYSYGSGKLKGLVVMTEEYDKTSGIESQLEKALSSIKIEK